MNRATCSADATAMGETYFVRILAKCGQQLQLLKLCRLKLSIGFVVKCSVRFVGSTVPIQDALECNLLLVKTMSHL